MGTFREALEVELNLKFMSLGGMKFPTQGLLKLEVSTLLYQTFEKLHSTGSWPSHFKFPSPTECITAFNNLEDRSRYGPPASEVIFNIGCVLDKLIPFDINLSLDELNQEPEPEPEPPHFMARRVQWE